MQLPEADVTSVTFKEFCAKLDVCMGGRVAEELSMWFLKLGSCGKSLLTFSG